MAEQDQHIREQYAHRLLAVTDEAIVMTAQVNRLEERLSEMKALYELELERKDEKIKYLQDQLDAKDESPNAEPREARSKSSINPETLARGN